MADLHQNKEISQAIKYALSRGWRIVEAGRSAHIKFSLFCPESSRQGHIIRVHSTPRQPENHAAKIRRDVDADEHSLPIP